MSARATAPPTTTPSEFLPYTPARVIATKVLAAISGLAYVFAIAAGASTGDERRPDLNGRASITTENLVFASVCFVIGVMSTASAVRIRHRMGRPMFEPWRGW